MRRPSGSALLLVCLALTAAGCGSQRRRPDILLITVDTLRADHLHLYGYPRDTSPQLEHWFADAAIFDRVYSAEANTSPSVVSLLSGLLPQQHRVRLFYQLVPEQTTLLPQLLPPGYQTAAFVSNPVLTDEAMGIAHRFDHYDDFVDEQVGKDGAPFRYYERTAARLTGAALQWLRQERDPSRPLFLWVHYIDPHAPYDPPPAWSSRYHDPRVEPIDPQHFLNAKNYPDVTNAYTFVDRYDEEIAFTDAEIGRLLEGYDERFPVDRALVVFTADHGETMAEHDLWFAHGYHVYEPLVRVPLMIRGRGVKAGRRRGLASGIDVTPTILGYLGIRPPAGSSGLDLIHTEHIPADRTVFTESVTVLGFRRAAIQADRKWVVAMDGKDRGDVHHLSYDLSRDPQEEHPEASLEDAPAARELAALIDADPDPDGIPADARKGIMLSAPKVAPRATADQRERLRGLGYLE